MQQVSAVGGSHHQASLSDICKKGNRMVVATHLTKKLPAES